MAVELNHTIVHAEDKNVSAQFLADILGLEAPVPFGPFMVVKTANGVSLDFINSGGEAVKSRHFAFLVSEAEFDAIFARIKERGLDYWADPMGNVKGAINTHFGGRGFYFRGPEGHWLEVITTPYEVGG
jgi:catechol 2,3-dioxygenase-like lactoylglutathione lyase family enzyme